MAVTTDADLPSGLGRFASVPY